MRNDNDDPSGSSVSVSRPPSESSPLVVTQATRGQGEKNNDVDDLEQQPQLPRAATRHNFHGALRVAVGAALFAGTNAAATALYRRNGSTVVSLYLIRSPFIYFANALLVAVLNATATATKNDETSRDASSSNLDVNTNGTGGSYSPATTSSMATDVLLLRTGSRAASRLTLLRSLLNATKAVLLSVGFVFMTYADAFVVFKGVAVCGTIIVARQLLGGGERLRPQELFCGIFVVIGILFIAPPPTIFGKLWWASPESSSRLLLREAHTVLWVPRQTAGVTLAVLSGLLSALSGTLMRLLSESAGPHKATPAMLLSYLMVVMFVVNGVVAVVGAASGVSSWPAWGWSKLVWPRDRTDYALIATNCACTLGGHLATAAGYQTTRAGIVAFLQLTEIPWVYLLDVLVLGEATTALKSVGSSIVFVGAVAVAVMRQR